MDNQEILLSIAIPTYNRKRELRKLLDSLKNQLNEKVEVLVCDNCSTDGTEVMVKENYPWVAFSKNATNEGPDRNFLHCYHRSRGKYVLLIGSDDIVNDNAVQKILEFITGCKEELSLIYLNHSLFVEKDDGQLQIIKTYLNDASNRIIRDRNEFLSITKCRITFMSCMMLNKSYFDKVLDPERYFDTSFIHTCIFFEASQYSNVFGVVSYPCILANVTEGASELDSKLNDFLMIFAYRMKKVFCDIGPEFGFDRKRMGNIYINEIRLSMARRIIKSKLRNIDIKEAFWKYVYPSVSEFPKAWVTIIPAYFLPRWVAVMLYKYIKPLVKGRKSDGNKKG